MQQIKFVVPNPIFIYSFMELLSVTNRPGPDGEREKHITEGYGFFFHSHQCDLVQFFFSFLHHLISFGVSVCLAEILPQRRPLFI